MQGRCDPRVVSVPLQQIGQIGSDQHIDIRKDDGPGLFHRCASTMPHHNVELSARLRHRVSRLTPGGRPCELPDGRGARRHLEWSVSNVSVSNDHSPRRNSPEAPSCGWSGPRRTAGVAAAGRRRERGQQTSAHGSDAKLTGDPEVRADGTDTSADRVRGQRKPGGDAGHGHAVAQQPQDVDVSTAERGEPGLRFASLDTTGTERLEYGALHVAADDEVSAMGAHQDLAQILRGTLGRDDSRGPRFENLRRVLRVSRVTDDHHRRTDAAIVDRLEQVGEVFDAEVVVVHDGDVDAAAGTSRFRSRWTW